MSVEEEGKRVSSFPRSPITRPTCRNLYGWSENMLDFNYCARTVIAQLNVPVVRSRVKTIVDVWFYIKKIMQCKSKIQVRKSSQNDLIDTSPMFTETVL